MLGHSRAPLRLPPLNPAPSTRKPLSPLLKGMSFSEQDKTGTCLPTALLAAAFPSCLKSLSYFTLFSKSTCNSQDNSKHFPHGMGGSCPMAGPCPPFSHKQASPHLRWGIGLIRSKQRARSRQFLHHVPRPAQPLPKPHKIPTWNKGNGLSKT